jgi:hypothetical protein
VSYYLFLANLAMLYSGLFVGIVSIRRKDAESALIMLIIILLAFIGLSVHYVEWLRVYSGTHGIRWSG